MSQRPNIVLVTVDSLRADHCGFMGYKGATTPTLDRMAADGLVFENAIAPGPSTPESMPATFTGAYPTDFTDSDRHETALSARRERISRHMAALKSLPERLSAVGYETAAFTPNPFTSRYFGFDAGFDHFQDFMGGARSVGGVYDRIFAQFISDGPLSMARPLLNWALREEVFKPWESYYDEIVEWTRSAEDPFFLWVFLMDVHNPYMASAEHRTQSQLDTFRGNVRFWYESHDKLFDSTTHERLHTAYTDSIRYADAFLARIQDDLSANSTFVVHADHGEAFGEHGFYGHEPYLYEENIHVPLVIDGAESNRIKRPISLRRLPSLILAIVLDESPADIAETVAIARSRQGECFGIRGESWKYIRTGDEKEFYDLGENEQVDRSDMVPLETFQQFLNTFQESKRERARIAEASTTIPIKTGMSLSQPTDP